MHLLTQHTLSAGFTLSTKLLGLIACGTTCIDVRSVSQGPLTFHSKRTMLACLRACCPFVNTDGWMRSTVAPVTLSSQTGATQRDMQQMCHTGWNQNSRPAWSCAPHQTGRQRALLADETSQCLCCSQLPVWKRTGLFVGCFDTPSHFVI